MATGFARTDNRVYVQNAATATIHMAQCGDDGRTVLEQAEAACGDFDSFFAGFARAGSGKTTLGRTG